MLTRFGVVVSLGSEALMMAVGRFRVVAFAVPFCRVPEGNIRLNIRTTDPFIILLEVLPGKHVLARFMASGPPCGVGAVHQAEPIPRCSVAMVGRVVHSAPARR
jgi:hypothetical protein